MASVLLSEGSTTKAKEAENFAFLVTSRRRGHPGPGGMPRVDAAGYLADAGIYTTENDMVYGMDGSDSRNERMILKVVAHLGDSGHKHNPVALSQLAEEARPSLICHHHPAALFMLSLMRSALIRSTKAGS